VEGRTADDAAYWLAQATRPGGTRSGSWRSIGSDPAGQEIAAAWIAKEKLRHALNLRARVTGSVPCERNVRDPLFALYDWCACNDDIPEAAPASPGGYPGGRTRSSARS